MERINSMKVGIVFSLLTLLYGFGLGGVFGAFEETIKAHLKKESMDVFATAYDSSELKRKKVTDKSWTYFKRAHLHANGLGTTSLVLILLLSYLPGRSKIKSAIASCLGIGALGYSMFWMFAGLRAPGLGSTGLAKESLRWLAMPTAGMCIIGLTTVTVLTILSFSRQQSL